MKNRVVPVLLAWMMACVYLVAAPVSERDVIQAVTGWLNLDDSPLGASMNADISDVQMYGDNGTPLFYAVSFVGGGYVVTSADDMIQPVIAFSRSGVFDNSDQNPLLSLLRGDMRDRVAVITSFESTFATPGVLSVEDNAALQHLHQITAQWQLLMNAANIGEFDALGISSVSDVRVSPLVQSRWGQSAISGVPVYNLFTPDNYSAGCVATAMAQVMRYHEYPVAGIGVQSNMIEVDSVARTAYTRGGDGAGGGYMWSFMPYVTSSSTSLAYREMISSLCYDAGVSVGMDFTSSGSFTSTLYAADGLKDFFGYSNAVKQYRLSTAGGILISDLLKSLNPNLDASLPVIVGITGEAGGHAIVCDGYGYNLSTMYHHMNMGWNGSQDIWYALPTIDTANYLFTIIYRVVYNIYKEGSGEVLSGRVVDVSGNPLSGVTVSAFGYSATTDSNGIYALTQLPAGTYTVEASRAGYQSASATHTIGTSVDLGACGNVWGADFALLEVGAPKILASVAVSGSSLVYENSSEAYTCTAYYSDGRNADVTSTASWSENSSYASIDGSGLLTAVEVASDQAVTLSVAYTEGGITKTDTHSVTIKDMSAGTLYSGGSGTAADPYRLAHKADLLYLASHSEHYSKYFIMVADIDLAGAVFAKAVIAANQMGGDYGYQGSPFSGNFNGGGHVVKNLTIRDLSDAGEIGLFGRCSGIISDLSVENANVSGTGEHATRIGAICGALIAGTIRRCSASGVLTATGGARFIGGLCGYVQSGTVEDSCSSAVVSGNSFVGGFCGVSSRGLFMRCLSTGAVSSGIGSKGGFCSWDYSGTAIFEDCFWDTQTSGMSTSVGGAGKTTAQMQTQSTFSGWDFVNTWRMDGYPVLRTFTSGPVANLSAISISGPAEMNENSLASFTCTAIYSDGSSANVTELVIWSENSVFTSVDGNGVLSALAVTSDQIVIISASYTKEGVTKTDTHSVTIKNIPAVTFYSGGSGTTLDPYQIATKADILYLGAHTGDYGKDFVLTADIDLAGQNFDRAVIAPDTSNEGGYQGTGFTGIFNGNGHVIKNLTISMTAQDYLGLFGRIYGSGTIVKNLGLVDVSISGSSVSGMAGALCGANYAYTVIENCYVTGSVSGNNGIGGFCGMNSVSALIKNCYSTCAVNGSSLTGGFCGLNTSGSIVGCFWDTETSGMTTSSGGAGRSTAQMMTQQTFINAGWDFVVESANGTGDFWYMDGYPKLNCPDFGLSFFTLTVENGTGSTYLPAGAVVPVVADPPPAKYEFFSWGSVPAFCIGFVSSLTDPSTFFTMPEFDVSLTPVYKQSEFEVLFDLAGRGNRSGGGELVQSIFYGADAEPPVVMPEAGWSFTGWNACFTNITSNLTVTAQYVANDYSLVVNNGSGDGVYSFGSGVNVTADASSEGYTFDGWDVEPQSCAVNLQDVSAPATLFTIPATNAILTAQYRLLVYNVTFMLDAKGTWQGGGSLDQVVDHGSAAISPIIQEVAGWRFTGWDNSFDNVTSNTFVTALYRPAISSIEVFGPSNVNERSSASYTCIATYGDGSTGDVTDTAIWSVDNAMSVVTVDNGILSVFSITSNIQVTVIARYQAYSGPLVDDLNVSITDLLYSGGSGSGVAPYKIATRADLIQLATTVTDYDKYFLQIDDIDLARETFANAVIAASLSPFFYSGPKFTGVFDGGGHVIRNLSIDSLGAGNDYLALFGYLDAGAVVCNLSVVDAVITGAASGSSYIGGICGYNKDSVVSNCFASLTASGDDYIGGICGRSEGGTFVSSYSAGSVFGDDYIGGFCGRDIDGSFANCFASAAVTGDDYVGGLGGYLYRSDVEQCYSSGSVVGDSYSGGFAGRVYSVMADGCFWDRQSSGYATSAAGAGRTTAEMQSEATFSDAGWDFANLWYMDGYPALRCFNPPGTYSYWLMNNASIPADLRAESDAPGEDCIPNLLKYACGLPAMEFVTTGDLMMIAPDGTNTFSVLYYKSKSAKDVLLQPLWAETLSGPWITVGIAAEWMGESAGRELWKASIPLGGSGFIRLRASWQD